jgi:hypothetical protein
MKSTIQILSALGLLAAACSSPTPSTPQPAPDGGMVVTPECPAAPTNVVKHGGETAMGATDVWKASEGVHQIENGYQVKGTLVIEPCAQVRLGKEKSIAVKENAVLRVGAQGGGLVVIDAIDPAQPWSALKSSEATSRIEVVNATLRNGGLPSSVGQGTIYMRGAAALAPTSTVLLVDNVRIENSADYGMQIDSNGAFDPASKGLTITGSKKSPIAMFAKAMGSIPSGTYTGNTNDWFQIDGGGTGSHEIDYDTTWVDRGLPIAPGFGGLMIRSLTGNGQLTLEPGVVVEMREPRPYMIQVGYTQDKTPTGAIVAIGTAEKPVTFRGRGHKADWSGIGFYGQVDPRSHFDHVIIEDVGGDDSTIGIDCVATDPKTDLDEGSGGIRFFLLDDNKEVNLRLDFLRNSTIRRSGSNGVLPNFAPGNGLDFCTSNTFEDIDICNQAAFTYIKGGNKFCPNAPMPSPCACE